jgi:SAM-dependent methyltransferase
LDARGGDTLKTSTLSQCRSCGGTHLTHVLSLGEMPLANALLTCDQVSAPENVYPLELALCGDCSLLQITEMVPPEILFREYLYFSSFSDTVVKHAQEIAERLLVERRLDSKSLVLEIASNDGYLLQHFVKAGVPVLGVEPAANIAKVAVERGIPTVSEFFGLDLAQAFVAAGTRADVVLANNVMAHVPDINGVVAGIRHVLQPDGVFVMETPYVKDLIDELEFDTIYHEHLFYYSLTALEHLFRRNGLAATAVEHVSIHGGSLRVTAVHAGREGDRPTVRALLDTEKEWGVATERPYCDFAGRVDALRQSLRALLEGLKRNNKRVAAYGAAAKGATLLNFMSIDGELLDFVVDRSTYKQGRFMPGVRLPIYPTERLIEAMPDYVLLLTWNFAAEIMQQQQEYRSRGGKFIVPVPHPTIVSA